MTAGEHTYTRAIGACSNYLSQSELSAHFGLGNADTADEVRVEWPTGTTTTIENVAANQTIIVTAP